MQKETELVNDVSGGMKSIAVFLDIEFSEILLKPTVLGKPVSGNTSFKEDADGDNGIYLRSLRRYEEVLSDKEICLIRERLVPLYESLVKSKGIDQAGKTEASGEKMLKINHVNRS